MADEVTDEELQKEFDKAPKEAKSVKVDIERALERETHDGKGDDEVPESNWVSFATDDVETSEED